MNYWKVGLDLEFTTSFETLEKVGLLLNPLVVSYFYSKLPLRGESCFLNDD